MSGISVGVMLAALICMWSVGMLAVWILIRGGTHDSTEATHRNSAERTESGRGVPVRLLSGQGSLRAYGTIGYLEADASEALLSGSSAHGESL